VDLARLHASDFFGEIAFLTAQPRTATVEAIEESDVLEVEEKDLNELIEKSPRIREVLKRYHEERVKSTLEKVREVI
jgi:CRP-like cAMP-binding protein